MFDLPFELPSGWEVKTVEQLIKEGVIEKPLDGNHGGTHPKASDYVEEGIPFVMASDLDAGMVDLVTCKFISEAQASKLRKGFSKVGDVLLSHKATIGRTAIVQDNKYDYIMLTPQVTYYRVKDTTKLNNVYLKAYFDSSFFQTILGLWAGAGSTRAYLGITGQLKLPVILPTMESQYKIAHQVKTLNDKIELNRQTNQTLEHMAQAIFKSWFVDFEPSRAKAHARTHITKGIMPTDHVFTNTLNTAGDSQAAGAQQPLPKNFSKADADQLVERAAMAAICGKRLSELESLPAETLEQLKTTAALFPETLVDSELGEVPEGWEVRSLGDFVSLQGGLSYKSSFMGSGNPMVTMGCIDPDKRFKSDKLKYYFGEFKVQHRLKPGDLVISTRDVTQARVTLGAPALIPTYLGNEIILATNMYKLVSTGLYLPNEYLFEILRTARYREQIIASAKGTTVLMLTKDALLKYKFAYPSHKLITYASKIFEDIYVKIEQSNEECERLSKLCDVLLPKLLSGELSIEETGSK